MQSEWSFVVANYQCRKNNLTWGVHHCINASVEVLTWNSATKTFEVVIKTFIVDKVLILPQFYWRVCLWGVNKHKLQLFVYVYQPNNASAQSKLFIILFPSNTTSSSPFVALILTSLMYLIKLCTDVGWTDAQMLQYTINASVNFFNGCNLVAGFVPSPVTSLLTCLIKMNLLNRIIAYRGIVKQLQ